MERIQIYGLWIPDLKAYLQLSIVDGGVKRIENVLCSVIVWVTFKSHLTVKGWVLLIDEKL